MTNPSEDRIVAVKSLIIDDDQYGSLLEFSEREEIYVAHLVIFFVGFSMAPTKK